MIFFLAAGLVLEEKAAPASGGEIGSIALFRANSVAIASSPIWEPPAPPTQDNTATNPSCGRAHPKTRRAGTHDGLNRRVDVAEARQRLSWLEARVIYRPAGTI